MSIGSWFSGNLGALGTFGSNIGTAIGTTYKDINTPTSFTTGGTTYSGVNPATGQPYYNTVQSSNTSMYLLIGGVALLVVAFVLIMMKRK